jgi:hypothetical protein
MKKGRDYREIGPGEEEVFFCFWQEIHEKTEFPNVDYSYVLRYALSYAEICLLQQASLIRAEQRSAFDLL